jgi:nicotinamide-nucleotide amidase
MVHEDRRSMKSFVISAAISLLSLIFSPVAAPATETDSKPLDYIIIVTGGELLEGVYADAHTPFLTRALRELGLRCVKSIMVDDDPADIQRALGFATNQASLIIVTGGLGPTPDDVTREAISEFTGIPLREHPEALAEMERRFNQSRDQLRPNLRRQTQVPTRGGHLKNAHGTAVGLIFDSGGSIIVALPGPPRELQPMVRAELVPFLRRHYGVRFFGHSVTLRFVGIGQSLIDQTLKDKVVLPPDIGVSSLFENQRVDFTFSVPGSTAADKQRLDGVLEDIRKLLSAFIYAEDSSTLEEVVVKKLGDNGGSLVLAEISSGGYVSAALTGAKGASELIAGAFAAPTAPAMARLLEVNPEELNRSGAELARALANAAARRSGSQWAIAIGPVESDEKGNKSAWLAFRMPDDRWGTLRLAIRDSWGAAHANLTTQVLEFLRRRLAAQGDS